MAKMYVSYQLVVVGRVHQFPSGICVHVNNCFKFTSDNMDL
jgi:hypothetical protein